jgi:hypothetical protein
MSDITISELNDEFIPDPKVKQRYHVSDNNDMWIARAEKRGFPAPLWIGGRKYRKLSELIAWERSLARGYEKSSGEAA